MLPAAIHASQKFLFLMVDAAVRSLLLGCFVALALEAFRVRSLLVRLLVWRGVLVVALAMPLLILISPAIRLAVPLPNLQRASAPTTVAAATTFSASASVPAQQTEISALAAPAAASPAVRSTGSAVARTINAPAARREIPWPILVFGGYLIVALAFFVRFSIGMHLGARLERTATPIDDPNALQILSAASRAAGLSALPRLRESEMLCVPVTLGVRQPMILFPSGWRAWDEGELEAVLSHEVSHVERRDALMQRVALIHRATFWFSPLGWWLDRHLARLSEHLSDEAALAGGADRTRYAEALLGFFAQLETPAARVWWQGVSMAKAGQAERRVERILAWRNTVSNNLKKPLAVILVAISVPVVAFTASVHPSVYGAQDEVAAPPAPQPPLPPPQLGPAVVTAEPAPGAPGPMVITPPPSEEPGPVPVPIAVPAPIPLPASPQETAPAPPAPPAVPAPPDWSGFGYFYNPWGPRFVIVTKGSDQLVMSGSPEDADHAKALRDKISGDFIWFEHDEKSYVIRDQATIDRARKLWAPADDLSKQSKELQQKEEELGKQMREQVQARMQDIRVKVPDLTAEVQKLQSELKDLNGKGATLQELGDLQREVGELQRELGQARWNSDLNNIQRQAGDLGSQMGELGRQIGELARQRVESARQAAEQMRQLLDDAITKGLAKPE